MNDIVDFVKNVKLVKFIFRVMDTPNGTISYERAPGSPKGYRYPLAEEYLGKDADETLEQLANAGLLERQLQAKELSCPRCGSIQLTLRLHCPNCDSTNVERAEVVEHLACGFQGPKDNFTNNICPKCGRPLGELGVDYVRQGLQHVCAQCGQIFQTPVQKLACPKDELSFNVADAPEARLYNYTITDRLRDEINKTINYQRYIQEKISALGFKIQSPAIMTGRSRVQQQFFLAATTGVGFLKTTIIVELLSDREVSTGEVFSLYARTIDVSAQGLVFAAIPKLADDAKKVADSYGMAYVEADDLSIASERLVKRFTELVETPEARAIEIFGGSGSGPPAEAA